MKKNIVITGATSGIGQAAAHALAKEGHHLIITGRSGKKLTATASELLNSSDNEHIHTVIMEQDSLLSVIEGAKEIRKIFDHIDVLINNTGAIFTEYSLTQDGIESSFGVNHLSHFLLTDLLLDSLKKSPSARIINVASEAHRGGVFKDSWIPKKEGYFGFTAYGLSKMANIVYSNELAKRLSDSNITVNSLHPGVVNTGFGKKSSGIFSLVFNIARPFMISPDKGSATIVYLATSEKIEGKSGGYYIRKKIKKPASKTLTHLAAEVLWKESLETIHSILPEVEIKLQ